MTVRVPWPQADFRGLLTFYDNMSAIADAYQRLRQPGSGWREMARTSQQQFRMLFQPHDIFERAGVYRNFGLAMHHVERLRGRPRAKAGEHAVGIDVGLATDVTCTSCGAWCTDCSRLAV